MTTTEILAELPELSPRDRRLIVERIMELDAITDVIEQCRRSADDAFLLLDEMEAEDATNESR